MTDPFALPDLAARALGGTVPWATDELFADRDNLVSDGRPVFVPHTFGPRGQIYDGWETRRRRDGGHDSAIVRLGVAAIVHAVEIDTTHFVRNYPPEGAVEACALAGYPGADDLLAADWRTLVPRSPLDGDARNRFVVEGAGGGRLVTHVRLRIYPDGGVARLRVHGEPVPDPRIARTGPFDLAAREAGARVIACSDEFYSAAEHLIVPGQARSMGEGWETSRRRDGGHDWVEIQLACPGLVHLLDLDTRYFVGNAPGWCVVAGRTADGAWIPLLERTAMQPDCLQRFPVESPGPVEALRLEAHPDGGLARLRAWGSPTEAALAEMERRHAEASADLAAAEELRP